MINIEDINEDIISLIAKNLESEKYIDITIEGMEFRIIYDSSIKKSLKPEGNLSMKQKRNLFLEVIPSYETFVKQIKRDNDKWEIIINDKPEGDLLASSSGYYRNDQNCFYILGLRVGNRYMRSGIGSDLVSYLEKFAESKCLTTYTDSNIMLLKFWKNNGFVPVKDVDKKYIVPLLEKLNNDDICIKEIIFKTCEGVNLNNHSIDLAKYRSTL